MDQTLKEPLKQLVAWAEARDRALLARVSEAVAAVRGEGEPEEAFLQRLLACAPASAAVFCDTERDLGEAMARIEGAANQGEVLKRLLDALQPFVERSAVFVLKQGVASLFASRGFEASAPRNGASVAPPPELEALMLGRQERVARPGEATRALLGVLGRFEAADACILPLRLRRRVVALLLVDSGLRQRLDYPNHVRLLARLAEGCLAELALPREEERPAQAQPATATQRLPPPVAESAPADLDPRLRAKAERSARVLVEDLQLYFPEKVEAGLRQGNLYALLREELERSLTAFVDRYGAEVEEGHHLFRNAVVASLCGGNPDLLGPAPWK